MILLFPQNRWQVVLATLEEAATARLAGLRVIADTVAGQLPARDALSTLLEARASFLVAAAASRYAIWRDAASPYLEITTSCGEAISCAAGSGGERLAALAESLGRLSDSTQQTSLRAARRLRAVAFALLVSLGSLIRLGSRAANPSRGQAMGRSMSPAQRFALARQTCRVPIKFWQCQSDCISAIAHPASLRWALPLPRSEFPTRPNRLRAQPAGSL